MAFGSHENIFRGTFPRKEEMREVGGYSALQQIPCPNFELRDRYNSRHDTVTSNQMKKWPKPLCQSVERSLDGFFKQLNGEEPTDLYQMVLTEMERPLLEVVMRESGNNQSRAARMLGLNRNTLRKKLRTHGLDR